MLTIAFLLAALNSPVDEGWPRWRGPGGSGSAPEANPPREWSEEKNVRWKVPVPGRGTSSPVVLGERLYLLTAVSVGEAPPPTAELGSDPPPRGRGGRSSGRTRAPREQEFRLIAFDRADGSIAWQDVARRGTPHEGTHRDGSYAGASAVTDGEVLIASFGSNGVFGYDLEGNQLWDVDLGDMSVGGTFGEGSSPALYGETVVVNWDHEGESFIVALDKRDGEERWRRPRPERSTWSTPVVVEHEGRAQVIVSASIARSYDLETGELLWSVDALNSNAIPTPIIHDGIVYLATGYGGSSIYAIQLASAVGELTSLEAPEESIVWSHHADAPYVPSPTLHDGVLYFIKSTSPRLSAFDAATGEPHYGPQRLEGVGTVYASLVAAADRIYVMDREGTTMVLKAGPEFEVLAVNELDDGFDASAAIVGDAMYLRGHGSLYCLAED